MQWAGQLVRTVLVWIVGYFSTGWFFLVSVRDRIADPSADLAEHLHRNARRWASLMVRLAGIQVEVRNPEMFDQARESSLPHVIASNHASVVDVILLLHVVPLRFAYMAKQSLFWLPIFGWYLWAARYIPVRREDARSAYRSLEAAVRKLQEGISIAIYAEGSRSPDGTLQPFKAGFARLAERTGSPVLPVAIAGSHAIIPKGAILLNPSRVTVAVGAPVALVDETGAPRDRHAIVRVTHDAVARLLEEART